MAASVPAQHREWWRNTTISRSFASGFAADPGLRPQQEPLITHWGVTHVDEAAAAQSWFTLGVEHELDDLFQSFHRVWRDDEPLARQLRIMISVWVPKTVMLLCLSTRELGEVPLVAFGEVAVVVEAPLEC